MRAGEHSRLEHHAEFQVEPDDPASDREVVQPESAGVQRTLARYGELSGHGASNRRYELLGVAVMYLLYHNLN